MAPTFSDNTKVSNYFSHLLPYIARKCIGVVEIVLSWAYAESKRAENLAPISGRFEVFDVGLEGFAGRAGRPQVYTLSTWVHWR